MGKAVIVSKSRGITDYIVDGETGILVEPGNVQVMRDAIEYLLADSQEAKRLGENGRQRIEEELNLEVCVDRLARIIREVLDQAE